MCDADWSDFDGRNLGPSSVVTARKRHRCEMCPDPIEIGSRHVRWSWLHEGSVGTLRVHLGCQALAVDHSDSGIWAADPETIACAFDELQDVDTVRTVLSKADVSEAEVARILGRWAAHRAEMVS